MGAAVKQASGGGATLRRSARVGRGRLNVLDGAQARELNWASVTAVLKHAEDFSWATFVYFIAEQPDGPLKIGTANDPLGRRRELQTGNPRHLRVEHIIYGDRRVEGLLHRTFAAQRIQGVSERRTELDGRFARDTEWFSVEARPLILATAEEIAQRQLALLAPTPLLMGGIVREVVEGLPMEHTVGDDVVLLAQGAGFVERKLRVAR